MNDTVSQHLIRCLVLGDDMGDAVQVDGRKAGGPVTPGDGNLQRLDGEGERHVNPGAVLTEFNLQQIGTSGNLRLKGISCSFAEPVRRDKGSASGCIAAEFSAAHLEPDVSAVKRRTEKSDLFYLKCGILQKSRTDGGIIKGVDGRFYKGCQAACQVCHDDVEIKMHGHLLLDVSLSAVENLCD